MSAGGVAYPEEIVRALGARPTEEQWRAISMPLEPFVVVAGAGSGKTSVMASRVVYLALAALGRIDAADGGVMPGNVLCLTFTNKATENLVLRVRGALEAVDLQEGEEPEILNYHSFAAQVIERYGLLGGIEPGQHILTQAQRTELCGRVLDTMSFEHVNAEWQPSLVGKILDLAEQAANHRVPTQRIVEFNRERLEALRKAKSDKAYKAALERIELAGAVQRFQDKKRELGVMDFGDQITTALDIVECHPEVSDNYRARFRTVLLDEYQDTNVAQADLIGAIFGAGFPVTAVGDPDQNIYAWRGASLFNLLQFTERFRRPDGEPARRLPLYTNFRSGARILAAADRVIEPVPTPQRPDPDKQLVPWKANGEGEVEVRRLADEWAEASWIASRIVGLHDTGEPWSGCAVLCRKSRLFVPIQQAFAERGIPVEIVGLAGLLKLPEIVEVLAYARAVADPYASVALARILLGPRYRVGFKDLARVAAWAKGRFYELRAEDEDEDSAWLFAFALEHLDEVEDLSDEGRRRLGEFRAELVSLRAEARRPVGEFLAEIMRRTGLLAELDASLDVQLAVATRRNLAAFLDEVHAFSPIEGDLTLRAFLDYVDTVEAADRPEWSPVQPSDEDSVKVLTIHQAKGLEFDTVFVPGLAYGLLPDPTVQQNPAEKGKSLDFELRGDAKVLPAFKGALKPFWEELREREMIEERRTCYVALTRARHRLIVTGAHWYGDGEKAKNKSVFFEELADWAEGTGMAALDRGPEVAGSNPLIGYRERFVRDWPGPARRDGADSVFPAGWRSAAERSQDLGGVDPELVSALTADRRTRYERLSRERRVVAGHLRDRAAEAPEGPRLPATVAVGGLIDFARCPKRFYWTSVRPLPRFSGPAARIGSQVHRWIELRARGQTSLLDLDEAPDLTAEELAGEPGKIERLQQSFVESRFADKVPLFAERPFLLHLGTSIVGGRIDAIYGTPDGPWEVVDYKTGKRPSATDPLADLQLDLYALACMEVWGKRPEDLTLTYLYLAGGEEATHRAGNPEPIREKVEQALAGISAGKFEPTPGDQCRWCDFLPFCEAGRGHVGTDAG